MEVYTFLYRKKLQGITPAVFFCIQLVTRGGYSRR